MKERVQDLVRHPARTGNASPSLRPVDGFVVGGAVEWETGQNIWLLLSRPGERLIDFFLEDDDANAAGDPTPCACAGVLPDGSLLVGEVDWELDRFLSEMLDEQEGERAR